VQRNASPHVVRAAVISDVPTAMASNMAVTVPQPWPGTHPDGMGETVGRPTGVTACALELPAKLQYVLCKVTVRRSPTWTLIECPLSASDAVMATAVRGDVVTTGGALPKKPSQAVDMAQSPAVSATPTYRRMGMRRRPGTLGSTSSEGGASVGAASRHDPFVGLYLVGAARLAPTYPWP
jgi:hypothetical protein